MIKQGMPPAHPGEILKGLYLQPLEISITDAAARLGVTRKTLSQIINGRGGISAEMAVRLSKALNTTPELWLNMQQGYDLWKAEKTLGKLKITHIRKPNTFNRHAEKL